MFNFVFLLPGRCIQTIISERLKQVCDTLADIDILDSAFRTASSRLSSLRQSKVRIFLRLLSQLTTYSFLSNQLHLNSESSQSSRVELVDVEADEEDILKQQLQTLRSEKLVKLTLVSSLSESNVFLFFVSELI